MIMNPFADLKKVGAAIKPPQPVKPISIAPANPSQQPPSPNGGSLKGQMDAEVAANQQQQAMAEVQQAAQQAAEQAQDAQAKLQGAQAQLQQMNLQNEKLKAQLEIEKAKQGLAKVAPNQKPQHTPKMNESSLLSGAMKRTTARADKALKAVEKIAAASLIIKQADLLDTVKKKTEDFLNTPDTYYYSKLEAPPESKPVINIPEADGTWKGIFRRQGAKIINAPLQAARDYWNSTTYDFNKTVAKVKDTALSTTKDIIRTPYGVATVLPSALQLAKEDKPYESWAKLQEGWNYGNTKEDEVRRYLNRIPNEESSNSSLSNLRFGSGLNTIQNFNTFGPRLSNTYGEFNPLMSQPTAAYYGDIPGVEAWFPMLANFAGVNMQSAYTPFREQGAQGFLPEIDPYYMAQLLGNAAQNKGLMP
jgi:hypothetical protein